MLKSICEAMGNRILAFCAASGKLTLLLLATLRRLKDANAKEVVRQMALLGADSLPIVMMTILCTGMVFSVQTAKEFVRLGASSSVGGIVAIAMARELVPVLTGVVVAGRIGAAIAAELGTMKVTEQIDALRVMAANPVSRYKEQTQYLSELYDVMNRAVMHKYELSVHKLDVLTARLNALSPTAKLVGGFGYIESNGTPVGSVCDVCNKDKLVVTLHDGRINAVVTEVIKEDE